MDDKHHFDDPELKAALQRAFAGDRAGEALRSRVQGILEGSAAAAAGIGQPIAEFADGTGHHRNNGGTGAEKAAGAAAGSNSASNTARRALPLWRRPAFAVAAGLLIACIGAYVTLITRTKPATVPVEVVSAMVRHHDGCSQPDRLGRRVLTNFSQAEFDKLTTDMATRLSVRILAADLRPDGWELCGGAVCGVKGQNVAHLLFKNPDGKLSVFTLPPQIAKGCTEGTITSLSANGHVAVAFVEGGSIYALVYDGNAVTADQLQKLLQKHCHDFGNPAAQGAAPVASAEMLRGLDADVTNAPTGPAIWDSCAQPSQPLQDFREFRTVATHPPID